MVGIKCGKCCVCSEDAYSIINYKPYCYKHGREHIGEAVTNAMAAAMKRHDIKEAPKRV